MPEVAGSATQSAVVCCREGHEFWFGLYKMTAPFGLGFYWYATTWYGRSTWAARPWASGYPRYRYLYLLLLVFRHPPTLSFHA